MPDAVNELIEQHAATRMFDGDHTLWSPDPTEIANRLGWLDEPEHMSSALDAVQRATDDAKARGIRHVVWCGMGGSSLFPELLAGSALVATDAPSFTVLDTSHPAAIARAAEAADAVSTLYVFASKSGGTLETRSQLDFFWARSGDPAHFAVVTDAGSALDKLATERGFSAVHHATPTIGGRYSALSHFGVVAASLLGVDVTEMLDAARAMAAECRADAAANPGLQLGALLGGSAREGRDKAVLDAPAAFAQWLEQLIAESTGKHDKGILPVPGDVSDADGPDRVRVSYGRGGDLDLGAADVTSDAATLGREVMRWEIATALAGAVLQINPFDQPDVEAAKQAASKVLAEGPGDIPTVPLTDALDGAGPGRYVALQAFVDPDGPVARSLGDRRIAVRDRTGAAATAAIGPRYLHSTGQLHKGGPPSGTFVQMLDADLPHLAIPGRDYGFHDLITAQAAGDYAALRARGRAVARVATDW
ncbi:MAG TPA: glucose-6-phosphate isomerase [Acidimicrobiia bacterium]